MKPKSTTAFILVVIVYSSFLSSCIDTKQLTYFNNLADSLKISLNPLLPPRQTFQVNDEIKVTIGGENEKTAQYISQYTGGSGNGIDVMVDIDGNIEMPKVGKLHISGLTHDEATNLITTAYSEYLQNPIISIKNINFQFSILGEVGSPGNFSIPNEKVNIFQALAQSGDITQYGKRDNVKIIRDDNGKREIITVNLNDKGILNSSGYYLQRNDIIYVTPARTKANFENFTRTTSIFATVVSFAALLITIFKK